MCDSKDKNTVSYGFAVRFVLYVLNLQLEIPGLYGP